jgi:hypothetical protein
MSENMSENTATIVRKSSSTSSLSSVELTEIPQLIPAETTIQSPLPTMVTQLNQVTPHNVNLCPFMLRNLHEAMEQSIKKVRPKDQTKMVHRRRAFFNRTNVTASGSKHRRDSYASLPSIKDIGVSDAELRAIVGLY